MTRTLKATYTEKEGGEGRGALVNGDIKKKTIPVTASAGRNILYIDV